MTSDRFHFSKRTVNWLRIGFLVIAVGFLLSRVLPLRAALGDYDIAQEPLYTKQSQPPLMMMVMSRDEQLFNKAYSDYSDLDDDKIIDTTYQDKFPYAGYFDSNLCYSYSAGVFKAANAATGTNKHSCGGTAWSGNFLNWVTMSRLDVMRYVLYGGQRSTDDATKTVLERAQIPNDLHAWVKVYTGTDINSFTPLTSSASFCNASISAGGAPLMRVASGVWSEWASTALYQCGRNRSGDGGSDTPKSTSDYTVRVEVCDPANGAHRESFCRKYNDGTTDHYKPSGLLQSYGESGRLRFGLVTGTYSSPRDGGVLRRNIGKIAGNGSKLCDAGDEINLATGQLCLAKDSGAEGIINTISNFRIDQWNWNNNWNDCNDYSILNRQGFSGRGHLQDPGSAGDGAKNCSAWGNPLAEMYAEALRYVGAGSKVYGDTGDLSGLPTGIDWKDPYRSPAQGGNSYCATCNILVMSSGLPSFDSDNIGSVPHLASAASATDALGAAEGLHGKSFMAGRVGETPRYASINTHEDICQALTVNNLSLVRGICPDIPSTEGSYLIAGLAKAAAETDLRPGLADKPADYKVTATTYTVAMAENLPKFDISVAGGTISLSPLCQANNTGSAGFNSSGWRSCFLGSVGIGTKQSTVAPNHVYGRPYRADGKSGSFSLVWEDSLWGNDHDNDVVTMLSYCVGAACGDKAGVADMCWRSLNRTECTNGLLSSTIGEDEVLVRLENLSAYAGNAMLTGYTIVGSNAATNVQRLLLRPGDSNGSVISTSENPPANWTAPSVVRYKLSGAQASQLESPLWYAAKYGVPNGKWDTKVPGTPDNYFLARNPAKLKAALEAIFASAAEGDAPVAGGGSGARISNGSFTVSASYKVQSGTNDWVGDVVASKVTDTGTDGAELWRASTKMSSSGRTIVMATSPTTVNGSGALVPVAAAPFEANNIPGGDRTAQLANMGFSSSIPNWFGSHTVADLVNYLKGSAISGFRPRGSILGDIVNSTTEIVSTADNYGYGSWGSTPAWKATLGSRYRAYMTAKKSRSTMLYVGANDGMLHAFDASTGTTAGNEVFAFIPSAALQHMAELANPDYSHRYYVDGALTSSDVYYGDAWHTVLVGSTGAGGATRAPNAEAVGDGAMFGLNISNPGAFTKDDVLWEVSGKTDSDMGFALGKPVIVPVSGSAADSAPRFVAIFGNGVNASSGKPVLFVVDIQTGEVLNRLAPSGGSYALRNGLINLAPVAAYNNNGIADTVYGGDMQGNLWKFDLRDPDPSKWVVAYGGAPLFTANRNGVAQPIMGGLEVSKAAGRGYNIVFGTGQYFTNDDNAVSATSPVQSLYGIWDNMTGVIGGRGDLVAQQITERAAKGGYSLRNVSGNAVNYVSKRGWYTDLIVGNVVAGERFVGYPTIQDRKVVFTSYEPGQAVCGGGGGTNWMYSLDLLTGGGSMTGLSLEIGGDSLCTGDCGGVALTKGGATSSGPPVKDSNIFVPKLTPCDPTKSSCTVDDLIKANQCTFVLRAPGADPLYMPRPCGRQSWRQVR